MTLCLQVTHYSPNISSAVEKRKGVNGGWANEATAESCGRKHCHRWCLFRELCVLWCASFPFWHSRNMFYLSGVCFWWGNFNWFSLLSMRSKFSFFVVKCSRHSPTRRQWQITEYASIQQIRFINFQFFPFLLRHEHGRIHAEHFSYIFMTRKYTHFFRFSSHRSDFLWFLRVILFISTAGCFIAINFTPFRLSFHSFFGSECQIHVN